MLERWFRQPRALSALRRGPLAPYLDSFADSLSQHGYRPLTLRQKLRSAAALSHWLARKHLQIGALNEDQILAFLQTPRLPTSIRSAARSTLARLLQQLRQAKVISPPPPPPGPGPLDRIMDDYEWFLDHERGLAPRSIETYLPAARGFLSWRFGPGTIKLEQLCPRDVTDFIVQGTARHSRRFVQGKTAILRSFLGFLLQKGRISINLAAVVPRVTGARLSALPRFLEAAEVEKVLKACDRRRKTGKRDYAILLLLARLGLRASEVVCLTLDDVDWRAGQLQIRGKGNRLDRLPLPQDVGQALADYLRKGRPLSSSRRVFVQGTAPHTGFAAHGSIYGVVRAALARAQLHPPHRGPHLFRHSLATRMLRSGASLTQIGQVLRHQQIETTEIYAKIDLNALKSLAQPWPETEL